MPIFAYECPKCGETEEQIVTTSTMEEIDREGGMPCDCGEKKIHIQAVGRQYCANEDADWIRSVIDVVDKDSDCPVTQRFIKEPTRANRKAWMKATGLRIRESGECDRREGINHEKTMDFVMRRHHQRMLDSEYRRYTKKRENNPYLGY